MSFAGSVVGSQNGVPRADSPAILGNPGIEYVAEVGGWNGGGVPVAVGARGGAILDADPVAQQGVHARFVEADAIVEYS